MWIEGCEHGSFLTSSSKEDSAPHAPRLLRTGMASLRGDFRVTCEGRVGALNIEVGITHRGAVHRGLEGRRKDCGHSCHRFLEMGPEKRVVWE